MARAENLKSSAPPKVRIQSRDDADLALKEMGKLQDRIAAIENREREIIRAAKERMVEETALSRKWLAAHEEELEKWSRKDEADWEGRTLALNFGRIFFRASTGAIALKRSVEYVLDHLKAKKLLHCIRKIEEPDKDAIKALGDDVLKEIGCKREGPDFFHYEVFKPEVK